jgi:hypothetical protein
MGRHSIILSLLLCLAALLAAACSLDTSAAPAATSLPAAPTATSGTLPAGTATGTAQTAATPNSSAQPASPLPAATGTAASLTSRCNLLNSRDVASFFSSAEVQTPVHKVQHVDQPVFATQAAPATESSCIYYIFHQPGKATGQTLQITYWLDVPDQPGSAQWTQAWADAANAGQQVPGIGDSAFTNNGRLTFKRGDVYITIDLTTTYLDLNTSAGVEQQMQIARQTASDILGRLPQQAPQ